MFMHCSNTGCEIKAKVTLDSATDEVLTVEVTGMQVCKEEDVLDAIHHSSTASRIAVLEALKEGVGATEAFEDVLVATNDVFLTKPAVRAQAARHKRKALVPECWPSDTMQRLQLIKRVQKDEIGANEMLPGYLQVRCFLKRINLSLFPGAYVNVAHWNTDIIPSKFVSMIFKQWPS